MRYAGIVASIVLLAYIAFGQRRAPADASRPPIGKTDGEKKILSVIEAVKKAGEVHLEVPVPDGRMLRLLAEAIDAKNLVEVGTSTGYSGLWLSLALQKTGGKLMTFELDPGRAATARRHFEQAGVAGQITIVQGDAHQNLKQVKAPIDFVFIDAEKGGYVDYLNQLLPLVRPGGVITAHNIEMTADYVRAVTTNPDLETVFYMQGAGLSVTLKKR
jgi:predicted O-methyltransferase YrrM